MLSHSEFRVSIIWTKKMRRNICNVKMHALWKSFLSYPHFFMHSFHLEPRIIYFAISVQCAYRFSSHISISLHPHGVMPSVPFSHNYRIQPGRRKWVGCVTKVHVMPCQIELIRLLSLFALVVHPSSLPTCSGFSIIILRTVPCKEEKK